MLLSGDETMPRERKQIKREVKDPQVRKQEILDTAMELFTYQGYEQTSMRDIAKKMNVSLGLCYRYFDSKQILFQEAMNQYVEKCCALFLSVLQNPNKDILEKIEILFQMMIQEEDIHQYHHFFHQPENKSLHDELSMRICQHLSPIILEEIQKYCIDNHLKIAHPDYLVQFLTYGQIGLFSHNDMPSLEIVQCMKNYMMILLKHELIPDE